MDYEEIIERLNTYRLFICSQTKYLVKSDMSNDDFIYLMLLDDVHAKITLLIKSLEKLVKLGE